MTYIKMKRKLFIEGIAVFPFILFGKLLGHIFPLKSKHKIFLIYSNADVGGAAVCNLDLIDAYRHLNPIVIFAKRPKNNLFIERYYKKGVKILDISKLIDYKIYHFVNMIFRGIISVWINKQNAVLFGGEAMYFYKILPHIKRNILSIELTHLNTWMNYNIGFIERIDKRIFSTERLKQEIENLYQNNNINTELYKRLCFLDNAIDIPEKVEEPFNKTLQVYFIGRGAKQKRVHLIAAVAQKLYEMNKPVTFNFIGNVENVIDTNLYPFCVFHGNISDEHKMDMLCKNADVLLLTSAYEGLPMVVVQMMAYGKPVISTAVNGIPDYITHKQNGLLIYSQTEGEIIEDAIKDILFLIENPDLRIQMGMKGRAIAEERFTKKLFYKNYRNLLEEA